MLLKNGSIKQFNTIKEWLMVDGNTIINTIICWLISMVVGFGYCSLMVNNSLVVFHMFFLIFPSINSWLVASLFLGCALSKRCGNQQAEIGQGALHPEVSIYHWASADRCTTSQLHRDEPAVKRQRSSETTTDQDDELFSR